MSSPSLSNTYWNHKPPQRPVEPYEVLMLLMPLMLLLLSAAHVAYVASRKKAHKQHANIVRNLIPFGAITASWKETVS